MKYYLAPLEGITGYLYRKAYHTFFYQMDKYFTPFLTPHQNKSFNARELGDILPEHNQGMRVVPQIMTNRAEDFLCTGRALQELGYQEVNLNLGCPSGTVVSKNKGSGFLAMPRELDAFLEEVFEKADFKISIKTRIGKDSPEEFPALMEIFNRYPLEELIIHPRIQKDYYKNKPNHKRFQEGLLVSEHPTCYNGDIFTVSDFQNIQSEFPQVDTLMLGRGVIANPGLVNHIEEHKGLDKQILRAFHDRLYQDYQEWLSGEKNVLFRMKELWYYMLHLFTEPEPYGKKIRKAIKLSDYEIAVDGLFGEQEIAAGAGFQPPL